MSLSHRILSYATQSLGFAHASITPAHPVQHAYLLDAWLAESRHGLMHYMQNHRAMREDLRLMEPQTQSVIVVAKSYASHEDLLPGGMRIARYAHHLDYHEILRPTLESLAQFIRNETGADVFARACTDSAPILERDLASGAGLGWIGKNSMLIHPSSGSFFLLAQLLVDLPLHHDSTPTPNRCGRCTRCIDACPTNAITAPYLLDARRCISYLTIELRGPIPRSLRPLINDYLFGCDICQDVCPWNSKHPGTSDPDFLPPSIYDTLHPVDLLDLSPQAFNATFRDTPLKRSKRRGILRNAAVVLGNLKDTTHLPRLIQALHQEDEPLVRGHVAWAVGQFAPNPIAHDALALAASQESDPMVLEEIEDALHSFCPLPRFSSASS